MDRALRRSFVCDRRRSFLRRRRSFLRQASKLRLRQVSKLRLRQASKLRLRRQASKLHLRGQLWFIASLLSSLVDGPKSSTMYTLILHPNPTTEP